MTKIAHFLAVLIYAKEDLCIKPKKTTTQTKNNSNLSSIYGKKIFIKTCALQPLKNKSLLIVSSVYQILNCTIYKK
ncbi:hypothetical protein BPUTSESOX_2346 [uncultured Gammaproteobacteria bacterium]|jgi:hypothetical protein|nr:hypothetical protein [uncultured Gammaproteobacteria bacterium]VVH51334.1 hypothetical protein BPUTSESOX_2346 [uncultured Gammaproteobacteria bacterium]